MVGEVELEVAGSRGLFLPLPGGCRQTRQSLSTSTCSFCIFADFKTSVSVCTAQVPMGNRPFLTDAGEVTESLSVDWLFHFANSRCWQSALSSTAACRSTENLVERHLVWNS